MTSQVWWYVARASGIVAWALAAAAVIWGLLLSTRLLERQPSPKWLLDLHRYLGGLTVVFTGVHLAGLVADSYVHFDLAGLLVPYATDWRPGPVAWGIVAFYLLIAVQLTSLLVKRLPRRLWHGVHLLSYLLFWTAAIHGAAAGTDAANPAYAIGSVATILTVAALTLYRALLPKRQRLVAARPAAEATAP